MTILGLSFSSLSRHPSSNSLNTFSTDAQTYYENASVITNGDEKNQQESIPKQHPHGNVSLGKGTFFISSSSNKALSKPSSTKCTFATIREYLYDSVSKSDTTVNHSWAKVNSKTFQVRSRNYFQDRQKADSAESLFPSRGVDFFTTDTFGPTNIGSYDGLLGGKLRTKPTFIINFRFPWGVLVYYYEIQSKYLPILRQKYVHNDSSSTTSPTTPDEEYISYEDFTTQYDTPHDRAMYKFIMNDDTYRNSKLKLIPKVIEGNMIVRSLVKGKPVIIGKKLPISYVYEPANPSEGKAEYWEADLDIGSSSTTAKKIVSVCKTYMSSLTVDIGFVVEGGCEEELPERILSCTRIHHFDSNLTQKLFSS